MSAPSCPNCKRIDYNEFEHDPNDGQCVRFKPTDWGPLNERRDALARHLWSEFGVSRPGTRTFDEQESTVRTWWIWEADEVFDAIGIRDLVRPDDA